MIPNNSASPWNSYVYTGLFKTNRSGLNSVTIRKIRNQIRRELGFSRKNHLSLRVLKIDVWTQPQSVALGKRNYICFSPCNWTSHSDKNHPLNIAWLEAWGTRVEPAHIHYAWPISVSNIVLPEIKSPPSTDNSPVLCQFYCQDRLDCAFITKWHVLWRCENPSPISLGTVTAMRTIPSEPPDIGRL